jgi:uncharacterized spore protein YtfJ
MESNPATPAEATRAENVLHTLGEKFAATANARTVFGEPIHSGDRTIIPVAKFGYGFGASSGGRDGQSVGGGGGGGGLGARPAGFIEITPEGARMVPFVTGRQIIATAVVGFTAGFLLGRFRR